MKQKEKDSVDPTKIISNVYLVYEAHFEVGQFSREYQKCTNSGFQCISLRMTYPEHTHTQPCPLTNFQVDTIKIFNLAGSFVKHRNKYASISSEVIVLS